MHPTRSTPISADKIETLIRDLVEARNALTAATSAGVELDRSELWRCADLVAAAASYTHNIHSYERPTHMIGEHHAADPAAVSLGRRGGIKGGKSTSEAKSSAARANGAKGGRPRSATKYHVVRLDYGIVNSDGHFHQTHHFSTHRSLSAAVKALGQRQREFNCVDIVDQSGAKVRFEYPAPE